MYRIDLIRTLSEAIKKQTVLNKDKELEYFLRAAEPDMKRYGSYQELDLAKYSAAGGAGEYTPANVIDVLKSIIPRISTLISNIRRNVNMYPTYMVTGIKTASYLRSLKGMMAVNLPGTQGELGFSGETAQFMKLKIIESNIVGDNKIYLSTKAPDNNLQVASIVDFIFNPLYIVPEVD